MAPGLKALKNVDTKKAFSCPLIFKFSRLEPETPQYFYYLSKWPENVKKLTEFQGKKS